MKIEVMGATPSLGMTLRDVRRFVEKTSNISDDEYVDCRVPSEIEGRLNIAALMGLITFGADDA